MSQALLPFIAPIARASDPATSHLAASEVRLGQLQSQFASVVSRLGPMTALEAAAVCASEFGGMAESYRKRAGECVRAGVLVVDSVRKCSVSGKPATVYRRATA